MYCTKCGKQAGSGDCYCASCGARLRTEEALLLRKKRRTGIFIAAAVLTLVLAGVLLLREDRPQTHPEEPALTVSLPETEAPTQPPAASSPAATQPPAAIPPATTPTTVTQPAPVPADRQLYLAREIRRENGAEEETLYRYDDAGRLAWKQMPEGKSFTYTYSAEGLPEKEGQFQNGEPVGMVLYDEQGNPRQETDLEGTVIVFENTYDGEKRLILTQKYAGTQLLAETGYTYNPDGSYSVDEISHAEGALHSHTFTSYDSRGRILLQTQDLESGKPIEIRTENTYDPFGNLQQTESVYDDGETRIHQITQYCHTCTAEGLPEKTEVYVTRTQTLRGETLEFPRKLEKTVLNTYDDQLRLIQREERGADNGFLRVGTWEYDAWGNLLRCTEDNGALCHLYEYLPLEQLRFS